MSGPKVEMSVVPIGGAVMMKLPEYLTPPSGVTFMAISRAVSGASGLSAFSTIYSGSPMPAYVDPGDGLPAPLSALNGGYVWNVTDDRGTTQVGPVVPASSLVPSPDYLSNLLIRLLQGGINNLVYPANIPAPIGGPIQVTTQMPQGGWQAMPFIVVNLDLIQQMEVGIGEDVNLPGPLPVNQWTLWSNAKRIWRVSVFSQDAGERDFYRDSLLSIFRVLKATVFAPLGLDVSHSYQAVSGTDAKEWEGHTPGFYYADLMLEIDGVFNTTILSTYGIIREIDVNIVVVPSTFEVDIGGSPVLSA